MTERERRWDERIREWADEAGVETSSARTYREHLARLPDSIAALGFPRPTCATDFSRDMVRAFKERGVCVRGKLAGRRLSDNTRAMDVGLLHDFLEYELSRMTRPQAALVKLVADRKLWRTRRGEPVNVGYLEHVTDVDDMVSEARENPELQAVIVLGALAGARPAEARNVTVSDCRLLLTGPSRVVLREAKWSKTREVSVPPSVRNVLMAAAQGKSLAERLYPFGRTKHGRDVSWAAQVSGHGHVRPMDLRRSYERFTRRAGARLEGVQAEMGHVRPETTLRYGRRDPEARDQVAVLLERHVLAARARR